MTVSLEQMYIPHLHLLLFYFLGCEPHQACLSGTVGCWEVSACDLPRAVGGGGGGGGGGGWPLGLDLLGHMLILPYHIQENENMPVSLTCHAPWKPAPSSW